jgi:hypothetical protein
MPPILARRTRAAQCPAAPVAQWIEQRFPKPRAHVRFMPGALTARPVGKRNRHSRPVAVLGFEKEPVYSTRHCTSPSYRTARNFIVTSWQSSERVVESGDFESRQRALVAEPAVEVSEAGARTLGITYWQAVDRFTRGGVRANWRGDGGKLKLLGGATLLSFGPAELSFDGELVTCRYAIEGGMLALRTGGSVTLAQRPEGDQYELSVTVEGYLPRLAARTGAPAWTGILYAKVQSPFHAAVSRRYFALLLRSRTS